MCRVHVGPTGFEVQRGQTLDAVPRVRGAVHATCKSYLSVLLHAGVAAGSDRERRRGTRADVRAAAAIVTRLPWRSAFVAEVSVTLAAVKGSRVLHVIFKPHSDHKIQLTSFLFVQGLAIFTSDGKRRSAAGIY